MNANNGESLTKTRFAGGTEEFMRAYDDVELASAPVCPKVVVGSLFQSRFSGNTDDFLADYDKVEELPPLPAELEGLQSEMHNWPLSRVLPEKSLGVRLRRMASSIFSAVGSGRRIKPDTSSYMGRPSDFTKYTDAQWANLFGPPEEVSDQDARPPAPLPFVNLTNHSLPKTDKPVTVIAPSLAVRRTLRGSLHAFKEKTGNRIRANSRKLMALGALTLTVVGIGVLASGDGAEQSNQGAAVIAPSALTHQPNDNYDLNRESSRDSALPAAPTESQESVAETVPEPIAMSVSAEPITLSSGESVWIKVRDRLQAASISDNCELTNRTAAIVNQLREMNPDKNLDMLPSGEYELGLTPDLLKRGLAATSLC